MNLKKICCVVVADNIPESILQQPDYRELLHRYLPLAKQVKLFGESREYYPDGHLRCRTVYCRSNKSILELKYEPEGYLARCDFMIVGESNLDFAFNPDGSVRVITFHNPSGYGFQLLRMDNWSSFTPRYLGKLHGIVRCNSRMSTFCTIYENGEEVGTITYDRTLD
jgi:hypothetical protein